MAVYTERVGGIILRIRAVLCAVKDRGGGDINQLCADFLRRKRYIVGSDRIYPVCVVRLTLTTRQVRSRRQVDNQGRTPGGGDLADRIKVGNIKRLVIGAIAKINIPAHHSVRAGYECLL